MVEKIISPLYAFMKGTKCKLNQDPNLIDFDEDIIYLIS